MPNDLIFGGNIFSPLITDVAVLHANLQGRLFCALTDDISLNNGECGKRRPFVPHTL